MLQPSFAGFLLLPLYLVAALMLPSSRPSKITDGARSVRETEGDVSTSQDSCDTIIASRDEQDTERRTARVSQYKPATKPNDGTVLASLGPRPLILGTCRITTPNPATSPKSRPPSSSSRRTPKAAPARWSSPLTPLFQLSLSPVLDEVQSLKAQLAASEALVKQLTKKRFEAASASRELFINIKRHQVEHAQWLEEREVLMGKLGLLDEVEATPGPLPSSEGVTPLSETHHVPDVTVGQPAASGHAHSEPLVSEVDTKDDDALERIGSIFLALTRVDDRDGCNTPSPTSTPTPSYIPIIDSTTSRSTSLSPPRAHRRSRQRGNATVPFNYPDVDHATPLSVPVLRPSLNALGPPCTPDGLVHVLAPSPARLVLEAPRPQPDLIDLASQTVGSYPCPEYFGRRDLNGSAKSFLNEVNATAAAGSRPSFNLATGVELHAAMARVSASTARPRLASEFTKWKAISEPQIRKEPIDPLHESGFAALVRSKRKRPIPQLRVRGFMPCSSPLADPSENPEKEQTRAEISRVEPASTLSRRGGAPLEEAKVDCLSSSPLVNPPENAKPKKRRQLGKLLKRVRSWISRSA